MTNIHIRHPEGGVEKTKGRRSPEGFQRRNLLIIVILRQTLEGKPVKNLYDVWYNESYFLDSGSMAGMTILRFYAKAIL